MASVFWPFSLLSLRQGQEAAAPGTADNPEEGGENDQVKTELIACAADIALLVGEPPKTKLMVSSSILASSSTVFAAMLSTRWRSQDPGPVAQLKQVKLPDDDPEVMSAICHFLHGKEFTKFLEPVDSDAILGFAITVDKYGWVKPLRMHSKAMLLAHLDYHQDRDLLSCGKAMAAAFMLDDSRAFYLSTGRMIAGFTEPYNKLIDEPWSCHFPHILLYHLSEKRAAAQQYIHTQVNYLVMPPHWKVATSPSLERAEKLRSTLEAVTWSPHMISYEVSYGLSLARTKNLHPDTRKEGIPGVVASTLEYATTAEEMCCGLCLACVKEDKGNLLEKCEDKEHV